MPAIICPYNKNLLQSLKGHELAVRVEHIDEAAPAAADVRDSGNTLLCIIVETGLPLDQIQPGDGLTDIPLVIILKSFGAFRNLARHISTLQGLDVTIHLSCNSPGNIAGLRILSSLGIRCCAVLGKGRQDWDTLADLMTYAVLGSLPHAPIEPFAYIASHYEPSSYLEWDFLYFNDPKRFLHMDEQGRLAGSRSGLKGKRFLARDISNFEAAGANEPRPAAGSPCASCGGFSICHGRFSAIAAEKGCSAFFLEMIDVAQLLKNHREDKELAAALPGKEAGPRPADIPRGKPAAVRKGKKPQKKGAGNDAVWIDPQGGASAALMLSGVLKQVAEKYPGRRYNLVARTDCGPILEGHPAISHSGHPPREAKIVTTAWWERRDFQKPGARAYQALARIFGLETPVEESLYVPWDLEDDPVLMGIVPRKERNVLICTGSDSLRKEMAVERWESLVAMFIRDGMGVVQAGGKNDRHVRGAYSIVGLLTPKQLISLPRHFDAVVTLDNLIMHAARLSRTPAVVLWGPTDPAVHGYSGDIHLKPHPSCEHSGTCIASATDCPGEFARCMNTIPVKTIHRAVVDLFERLK